MTVKELEVIIQSFKEDGASRFDLLGVRFEDFQRTISDTFKEHARNVTEGILKMRAVHIDNLVKSNRSLIHKNNELEYRVTELEDRLASVERQINQVEQNNRKSNVEISGIPDSVNDNASLKMASFAS